MGELILMLLLTCAVCGGIPALAFAYINGKIKFFNRGKAPSEKQKRTVFRWLAFLLGSFMGVSCFRHIILQRLIRMTLIGTAFTYPLCGASSWVRSYRRRSRTKRAAY